VEPFSSRNPLPQVSSSFAAIIFCRLLHELSCPSIYLSATTLFILLTWMSILSTTVMPTFYLLSLYFSQYLYCITFFCLVDFFLHRTIKSPSRFPLFLRVEKSKSVPSLPTKRAKLLAPKAKSRFLVNLRLLLLTEKLRPMSRSLDSLPLPLFLQGAIGSVTRLKTPAPPSP
jgi:hypothetical protein